MTATAPAPSTRVPTGAPPRAEQPVTWARFLAWTVALVVAADVLFMLLAGAPIPPLILSVALSLAGLWLLRRRQRAGVIMLGVVHLPLLALWVPLLPDFLAHPESGIDFVHAVVAVGGRLLVVGAAVAALRRAPGTLASRVGAVGVGLLAVALTVGVLATVTATGDEARPGDVIATLDNAAFPEDLTVASGDTVFLDNTDLFRHTFTVEGTAIDVELPARQGVRMLIDLAPGTYDLICAIPGHEFMDSTLVVR